MEKINANISLWTPLVGFNLDDNDCGVSNYLKSLNMKPNSISLFVFNADIINLHKNMYNEYFFPKDYCNYYGSERNEIRQVQAWTNWKFRELVGNLKAKKIETYLGVMGAHVPPNEKGESSSCFGYTACQKFLVEHPELVQEGVDYTGNTYLLKRFADGSYFEDYFADKVLETLNDYDLDGVHLSDALMPPCIQLEKGDFSLDMIEQFSLYLKENLGIDNFTLLERAKFIWENKREEWIFFISERWRQCIGKLCSKLHSNGKKVMINNVWTGEPFDALYRYGVDYRKLSDAGVDIICLEDQANAIYVGEKHLQEQKNYEYYLLSCITRAYAPHSQYLAINFVKDSTEESSIISHLPMACESEILSLSKYLYYDKDKIEFCIDGFFVCLADALKKEEWQWLSKRYAKAFSRLPQKSLSPLIVWSDNMIDKLLPSYIATRRWSTHKTASEIYKEGVSFGGVVRIENINLYDATLFVANIDLLSKNEIELLLNYKSGKIIYTSLRGRVPNEIMEKTSFTNQDINTFDDDNRLLFGVMNLNIKEVKSLEKLVQSKFENNDDVLTQETDILIESPIWLEQLRYRKVSDKFINSLAKVINDIAYSLIKFELDDNVTLFQMKDNIVRVVVENEKFDKYKFVNIYTTKKVIKYDNVMDFPIQSPKIILANGNIIANADSNVLNEDIVGFIMKCPPKGIAIMELHFEEN